MSGGLDELEALWRQAAIDAANPQSRLKIAGSLPQTRLVQALYKSAEAIIAGLKAVNGLVDHMEELRAAIMEAVQEETTNFGQSDELAAAGQRIKDRVNLLFGDDKPANDAKATLKVVQ